MSNPASFFNWRIALNWLGAACAALLLFGVMISGASADEGKRQIDAKGDKCVRDTEYMRRNHMELLKHQRDDTMRKGIRTPQYSLKNCVDCHASPKNNSVIGANDNFCQGCHSYVSVKLDCFECHSSKPKDAAHPPMTGQAGAGAAGTSSNEVRK